MKNILRLAAAHDWLTLEEVERWFRCRDNRNNPAHDYGEAFARETPILIPSFPEDMAGLAKRLDEKLGKEEP